MIRRTKHAVLAPRRRKAESAVRKVAGVDVVRPEPVSHQAVETVSRTGLAISRDPLVLVVRWIRDLPQAAAVHADLVQAIALGQRTAVAEHDAAGIEREVVAVEDAAAEFRSDFAHLAVGRRQHAQVAAPTADVLEVVVVVLAVVRVALDEEDFRVLQQRVQLDQHAALHRRNLGHQAARCLIGRIEPLFGLREQPLLVFVQAAEQFGRRIRSARRSSQFLHRGAQPIEIAAQRGENRRPDAEVEPARIIAAAFGLLKPIEFRTDRYFIPGAVRGHAVDKLFLELRVLPRQPSRRVEPGGGDQIQQRIPRCRKVAANLFPQARHGIGRRGKIERGLVARR